MRVATTAGPPVSIALIVCRDTPSAFPSWLSDRSCAARHSRTRLSMCQGAFHMEYVKDPLHE